MRWSVTVGGDGTLRFATPVARPPAGAYRVSVGNEPASLFVTNEGTMRLGRGKAWSRGQRLTVAFAEAKST